MAALLITTSYGRVLRNRCTYASSKIRQRPEKVMERGKEEGKRKYRLCDYDSAPAWAKGNKYILDHYRADWPPARAIRSVFELHNETLNIWTHLLGFFFFASLAYCRFMSPAALLDPGPQDAGCPIWPFATFLCGAMICLFTSSCCHCLCCHTSVINLGLWKMDFIGIAIMIASSFFPPVYYGFMCHPTWRLLYLTAISVLCVLVVTVSVHPRFFKPGYYCMRAILFGAMACSGIVPMIHKHILLHPHPVAVTTTFSEILMGLVYGLGAVVYANRVPERWAPGWFDLAGHSHQIMHVMVVVGAWIHYNTGLTYMQWREEHGCPALM